MCDFVGVKPPSGVWTSKAISFMNQLVKDKVFTVKVVDKESYTSVVELVDASVTPVVKISSHLIQEGCAAEESRMMFPAVRGSDVEQTNDEYKHVLLNWQFYPPAGVGTKNASSAPVRTFQPSS